MCKTPYPLFRGVRDGTRYNRPFTLFIVWKRSSNCRNWNSTGVWSGNRGPWTPPSPSEKNPQPTQKRLPVKDSCPGRISDHVYSLQKMQPDTYPCNGSGLPSHPTQFRGTTRPSTPPSSYWCEEDYPKVESPFRTIFFSFSLLVFHHTDT